MKLGPFFSSNRDRGLTFGNYRQDDGQILYNTMYDYIKSSPLDFKLTQCSSLFCCELNVLKMFFQSE